MLRRGFDTIRPWCSDAAPVVPGGKIGMLTQESSFIDRSTVLRSESVTVVAFFVSRPSHKMFCLRSACLFRKSICIGHIRKGRTHCQRAHPKMMTR